MMTRIWTKDEERRLRDYLKQGVPIRECSLRLHRSLWAVYTRKRELEKRSAAYAERGETEPE